MYHPSGEEEEVVAIKKGLASIFASRLHEEGEVLTLLVWSLKFSVIGWNNDVS